MVYIGHATDLTRGNMKVRRWVHVNYTSAIGKKYKRKEHMDSLGRAGVVRHEPMESYEHT